MTAAVPLLAQLANAPSRGTHRASNAAAVGEPVAQSVTDSVTQASHVTDMPRDLDATDLTKPSAPRFPAALARLHPALIAAQSHFSPRTVFTLESAAELVCVREHLFESMVCSDITSVVNDNQASRELLSIAAGNVPFALEDHGDALREFAQRSVEVILRLSHDPVFEARYEIARLRGAPRLTSAQEITALNRIRALADQPQVRDFLFECLAASTGEASIVARVFQRNREAAIQARLFEILRTQPELEAPILACAGTTHAPTVQLLIERFKAGRGGAGSSTLETTLACIDHCEVRETLAAALVKRLLAPSESPDSRFAIAQQLQPVLAADSARAERLATLISATGVGAFWGLCREAFGLGFSLKMISAARKLYDPSVLYCCRACCAVALLESPHRDRAERHLLRAAQDSVDVAQLGIRSRIRDILSRRGHTVASR